MKKDKNIMLKLAKVWFESVEDQTEKAMIDMLLKDEYSKGYEEGMKQGSTEAGLILGEDHL